MPATLAEHRHLGSTASGTPVYVDDRFVSADLHITLGFIEPHLMLGFSGGRKLVAPGLAAQETIKVLHSPKFMREPRAVEGSIEDNPLHRELLEIAAHGRGTTSCWMWPWPATARSPVFSRAIRWRPIGAGVEFVSKVHAGDAGPSGGCRHHHLRRLPARPDLLPGDQGHYRGFAHREAGRQDPAAGGLRRGSGRAGVPPHAGREPVGQRVSGSASRKAPVEVDQWQLEKLALVTAKAEVLFYVPGPAGGVSRQAVGPLLPDGGRGGGGPGGIATSPAREWR